MMMSFDYKYQNALGQAIVFGILFFCEESLVRDTNLHNKDCSEMHSGSRSHMTSSCRSPVELGIAHHSIRIHFRSSETTPCLCEDNGILRGCRTVGPLFLHP